MVHSTLFTLLEVCFWKQIITKKKKLVIIEGFESGPTFIKSFSAVPTIKCAPPKHYIICLRYDKEDISFYDK